MEIDDLYNLANANGIPITPELISKFATLSFDTRSLVDTLIDEWDISFSDQFEEDDLYWVVNTIWTREFSNIFGLEVFLSKIGYWEHDLIPDLKFGNDSWNFIKSMVTVLDENTLQKLLNQYEFQDWVQQFVDLVSEQPPSEEKADLLQSFLEEFSSIFLKEPIEYAFYLEKFIEFQVQLGDLYFEFSDEKGFEYYNSLLNSHSDKPDIYLSLYNNYEHRLEKLPQQVDYDYLLNLLQKALNISNEKEADKQDLLFKYIYEEQIRILQQVDRESKWKIISRKLQSLQFKLYRYTNVQRNHYLTHFAENHHSDDKSIPVDFICYICRLSYSILVDSIYPDYDYLTNDQFLKLPGEAENGRIIFPSQISCPHCSSSYFILQYVSKLMIYKILNSHPETNKIKALKTEDMPSSINKMRGKIKEMKRSFKQNPSNMLIIKDIGALYLQYNLHDFAKKYFIKAVKMYSGKPTKIYKHAYLDSLFFLSLIYYGERDNDESLRMVEKFIKQIVKFDKKYLKQVSHPTTKSFDQFVSSLGYQLKNRL